MRAGQLRGEIPLSGNAVRWVTVPADFIRSIGDALERDFGETTASALLYEIGRASGKGYVDSAKKIGLEMKTVEDVKNLFRVLAEEFGWSTDHEFDVDFPGKFARIRWKNGVEARPGRRKALRCHIGRGILAVGAETLFGVPCDCIEVQCQAQGAPYCEVVVGEKEKIMAFAETL